MEFKKILVPVVGTEADEEAMKLACRLAKKDKGKVWAVSVVAVKRALPLDAEIDSEIQNAENVLDRVEVIAEEEDYEVETDVLQAREAGSAIIDEAVERGVDLILMGIQYKRRFGQFSLGNVAPYVLKNAPCPVMLYQQ
jgi:nucleotide-binding universal stress UspA family protein